MGEICKVCGAPCPLVEHWHMGGAPGEYEEAMAAHWRIGYERSQEALAAANARAEMSDKHFSDCVSIIRDLKESLAAARRECEGLRAALSDLIQEMNFGGGCDGNDPSCDGCVAVTAARAALDAPAAGEEGKR